MVKIMVAHIKISRIFVLFMPTFSEGQTLRKSVSILSIIRIP